MNFVRKSCNIASSTLLLPSDLDVNDMYYCTSYRSLQYLPCIDLQGFKKSGITVIEGSSSMVPAILYQLCAALGVNVVRRRACYILELLGLAEEICSDMTAGRRKGYMWLDPLGPKRVLEYSKKYGLMINRTRDELKGWMMY